MKQKYRLVDEALTEELSQDEELRRDYLILDEHPDFKGRWVVESFSPSWFFDLRNIVGPYKVVSPASLEEFMAEADSYGYKVAFFEEPFGILGAYEALNAEPEVALNSHMDGTVKGMLPFQVQGYNYLKDLDGGVAMWSTGTGKTVLASALLKYHRLKNNFDLGWVVVKAHNKVNTQRTLLRLADIPSVVLDGSKDQRVKQLGELSSAERGTVVVTNYEKFRTDLAEIKILTEDRDILMVWDEMPTKLKTRTTQLYKSVCECLYRTPCPAVDWERRRPHTLRQYMLSATPIENDPEDFFNTVRLLDPRVFGTVAEFRNSFVASYSFFSPTTPEKWHNLDKLGLMAAHITHQVDKSHPEIADQFPDVIEEPYYIDWDPKDHKIYNLLLKEAEKIGLEDVNILALIGVLQMLCDAPSMVTNSAARREGYEAALEAWIENGGSAPTTSGSEVAQRLVEALGSHNLTDERHTKLATLKELTELHSDEKIIVFSSFNEGLLPIIEDHFTKWGVTYVRYDGTTKQKQAAQDKFTDDPDVQVFLSSDQGSDSLSLEQASVVIHYDLPWKWSTLIQRQNRVHRIVSGFDKVRFYTLMMANSVEDRKMEIIQRKQGYHEQVFKGVQEGSDSARMTKQDLYYILTGEE